MTAIEATNTSTCVPERKGQSQKTTAASPAKYLIAFTTNRLIGLLEGVLALRSPGIRAEGGLSAAPHLAQKIRPGSAEAPHFRQFVPRASRSVASIHQYHTVSVRGCNHGAGIQNSKRRFLMPAYFQQQMFLKLRLQLRGLPRLRLHRA